jgi:hypothetical protein
MSRELARISGHRRIIAKERMITGNASDIIDWDDESGCTWAIGGCHAWLVRAECTTAVTRVWKILLQVAQYVQHVKSMSRCMKDGLAAVAAGPIYREAGAVPRRHGEARIGGLRRGATRARAAAPVLF